MVDLSLIFDIIVVGFLTHDIIETRSNLRETLGGTAAYASIVASKLGAKVGVVSKVGRDFEERYKRRLRDVGVDLEGLETIDGLTTVFRNIYCGEGERIQEAKNIHDEWKIDRVPPSYIDAQCFHFGPLIQEVSYGLIEDAHKRGALTSLDVQGYCRRLSEGGRVQRCPWKDAETVLSNVDVFKGSFEEATTIANDDDVREAAETLGGMGPEIILITSGKEGSYIYDHKTFRKIQPYPIDELVDPTGAGDAYSAGFLVRYLRTGSPIPSARFASCLASFIVQGWGASNPPAEETVLEKMRRLHSERDNAFTWMDSR